MPLTHTEQYDGAALRRLAGIVDESGLRSFHAAFGDGNVAWHQWQRASTQLEDPLLSLVELLLLMRPVARRRVQKILGATVVDALQDCGVLQQSSGAVHTNGLVLNSFRSLLFFHEISMNAEVYFGRDSIALAVRQRPVPRGTALDLGTGCGAQAMVAAQHAARVHAIEINERAAAIAALNVALNGLASRVRVVRSSLEEYAATRRSFDLITLNPPMLPVPAGVSMGEAGHGGGDGLAVTRRALASYIPHLRPDGSIDLVGCGLGADGRPLFLDDLAALLAGCDAAGQALLLGRSRLASGDPYYEALVVTGARVSGIAVEDSRQRFDGHFRALERTDIFTFFLRVQRQTQRLRRGRIAVADLSPLAGASSWFL